MTSHARWRAPSRGVGPARRSCGDSRGPRWLRSSGSEQPVPAVVRRGSLSAVRSVAQVAGFAAIVPRVSAATAARPAMARSARVRSRHPHCPATADERRCPCDPARPDIGRSLMRATISGRSSLTPDCPSEGERLGGRNRALQSSPTRAVRRESVLTVGVQSLTVASKPRPRWP
jgi:hypothetical protein